MATTVTARRGASDRAPENTLAAIHQAVESGADRIEVDVHASRDGRLVLHHFYVLGETDDGEGLVFERDAAYLRALDVGGWFDPVYRGERMPFLEEVFAAVGDAVEYELDLKGFTLPFLDAVLALTYRYGVFDRTEFTSPHLFLLTHLKRREPRGRVGLFAYTLVEPWMTPDLGWTLMRQTAALGDIDVVHCAVDLLTPGFVAALHADGRAVYAANCDTEEDLRRAYELGVDCLSTGRLELALRVREQYHGILRPQL
jgi:glycerophosphoryl diester phosphodiesterase